MSAHVTRERPAASFRAILIGLVCAASVCALVPFNDFVYSDTSLAAGFFPLAAALGQLLIVLCLNTPLRRFAPAHALTTGEQAVILMMLLIGASLPNWGMMKFLAPTPVAPFYYGSSDAPFWNIFMSLGLPEWLFPVSDMSRGTHDPAVSWFYNSRPQGESIPWSAWLRPALAWGVLIGAMVAALVSLARILVPQWQQNERLPFPIVQIHVSLIEAPKPGRLLNDLFRSKGLWIALGAVFVIHTLSLVSTYYPRYAPRVPLSYDFTTLFDTPPLSYLRSKIKANMLSFTVIGATFFIRSRVAFSLWAIYLITAMVDVQLAVDGSQMPEPQLRDMHLGACVAFIAGVLFIGRHHWKTVFLNAIGRGVDSTHRVAFWTLIVSACVMFAWLVVVGASAWIAALIVAFVLGAHFVVLRVVAETGLPFFRAGFTTSQVYSQLPAGWTSTRDVYLAATMGVLGTLSTRDSVMVAAGHGMATAQASGAGLDDPSRSRAHRFRFGLAMVLALVVGATVAGASTLYVHYTWPTPTLRGAPPERNNFGAVEIPRRDVVTPVKDSAGENRFPPVNHNPAVALGTGAGIVALLQILSLRVAAWPFLPVGFVTSHGAFIQNAWFSIFVGWLAKTILVRWGGASMFNAARPVFVGLILGESLAALLGLLVNFIAVTNGYPSQAVKFLL
jgi:hypothetical protein